MLFYERWPIVWGVVLALFSGGEHGVSSDVPVKKQEAETINRIKDYGLKNYVYLSKDLPHVEDKPWKLVCQMPYNCHFQPWIRYSNAAGKMIKLESSNPLVLYLTKAESFEADLQNGEYEARNWISGEGAVYTIPAGVKVEAVMYRETGYNTQFAGSFECNDNDYNVLWKKGARTAYICMRDHFYDCPDRERVGFWGDGTPEMNQCFYAFDTASHALCKDLVLRPLQAGFYPGQQLEFLGEYGLWYYYMQTGDLESIAKVYESTRNFLFNTYQMGKKGQWFDWGVEVKDIAVTENAFMYIDLQALKKMSVLTGHASDSVEINARMDSIKQSFNARFWKGGYYMSSQVATPDDRANAMAVNAGLAEKDKWNDIYNNVLTKYRNASCFFDRWVFEALCKMGREDYALIRMYDRYKTMIPCSFTTLWEHYDRWWASRKNAFDDASSLNHGWNPPVILLSQIIAGVSPESPGWDNFHVLPKEAFLKDINVVVPSVKGNIPVKIHKDSRTYSISLTAPSHTKAVVGIPKSSFIQVQSVSLNGKSVWINGKPVANAVSDFLGEDEQYIKFQVPAGKWNFVAKGMIRQKNVKEPGKIPTSEHKLNKKSWTATSSVKDSFYLFSGAKIPVDVAAANAIDGDHWTGWRDMSRKQHSGQWFVVDMKSPQKFDKVVLDNTWALWDSPEEYALFVSSDGKNWGRPVASGKGKLGITEMHFPSQMARYIKIVQTGSNETYNWSIYEIDVCRRNGL